jgi:lipopolysaccharide exporter
MEERAIRGVPWTFLSYASSKALGVLTTLVLARLLVPADFGVMALALVATSFLSWIGDLGFAGTLIARQDLDRAGQATLFSLMLVAGVVAGLVGVAVSPLAGDVFHAHRLTWVLMAMSSVLAIGGIAGFYEALMLRELEFRRRFAGYVVQSVTNAGVAIPLAAVGTGVWSLVAGQVASFAAFAVLLVALAPYRLRPRYRGAVARDLVRTSRGFLVQGVTVFVRQNVDSVVVGRLFGPRRLGYYSMATKLGELSYWGIAEPVARVTFSGFARSHQREEDIRPTFLSILRLVALVSVPFGILLSAAADPLVHAIFGRRWLPMVGPLTVLGLWAGVRPLDSLQGWVLNAVGRAGVVAKYSIVVLVPLIPAFVVIAHVGTLSTVALVVLADTLFSLTALSYMVRRHLDLSLGQMWVALRPVALAAPVMWVATWSVGRLVGPHHAVLGLPAAVLAGLAAYAGTLWLLDPTVLPRAGSQVLRTLGRASPSTRATPTAS